MGFIRGTALVLISSLLFIALLLSNLFLTVNWSLEHETLYPQAQNLTKKILQEYNVLPEINSNFQYLELYCVDQDYYAFNSGEYSFKIPCDVVKQGQEATIDYGIGKFINETYYAQYDCEILECIKTSEQPFVLISEKTKDYFHQKFKLAIFISIILLVLLILFSKKTHNGLITAGVLVGISAIPFKEVTWITNLFKNSIVFEFIGIFFSRAHNVFLIMLIAGIILFVAGLGLMVMKYGLKFSSWFRKKSNEETENLEKEEKENKLKKEVNVLKEKLKSKNKKDSQPQKNSKKK